MMELYLSFSAVLVAVLAVILIPVFRSKEFTQRQRYRLSGALFIFSFVVVFGVYYGVGAPEVVPLQAERQQRMTAIRDDITRLSQALKDHPDDARSWAELGDNFMQTGQFKGAVNAYKQAVILSKGNPRVIMAFVEGQIADAQGVVTEDAKKGLTMVLMQEPGNSKARYWSTVALLQAGKNAEAMKQMRALYQSLAEDDPVKKLIDKQIGRAK